MEDGEKVCFVVSSECGGVSWEQQCLSTASRQRHIGSDANSVSTNSDIPLQCSSAMHKYTLMQTEIQKHLNYISIIYNYSGIKIDLRLQLASCLRTAVLQQRPLCFQSTAIITVDCVLTTRDDCKAQIQGYLGGGGGGSLALLSRAWMSKCYLCGLQISSSQTIWLQEAWPWGRFLQIREPSPYALKPPWSGEAPRKIPLGLSL